MSCILALAFVKADKFFAFYCTGLLNELLFILYSNVVCNTLSVEEASSQENRNSRINRILTDIDNNYQHKILLSDLATREGVTMTYLSHVFKETLNMSFQNYLAEKRFSYAIVLLETTDLSILDISLSCGFSDVRYLNRLCQKHFSCSPIAYRKTHRKRNPAPSTIIQSLQHYLTTMESQQILENMIESMATC